MENVILYHDVPVMTTKQIAEMYGTDSRTLSKDFNRNKLRFKDGKHYFCLFGDELKEFKQEVCERQKDDTKMTSGKFVHHTLTSGQFEDSLIPSIDVSGRTKLLYLWTQNGALYLAKSINTDKAWEAYERLVDIYFTIKEQQHQVPLESRQEVPKLKYQTSGTKVPKNPSWYERNRRRLNWLSEQTNTPIKTIYHYILKRLGEEYDLNAANRIYEDELGYQPEFAIDIVGYFPELGRMADDFLDQVTASIEKKSNSKGR